MKLQIQTAIEVCSQVAFGFLAGFAGVRQVESGGRVFLSGLRPQGNSGTGLWVRDLELGEALTYLLEEAWLGSQSSR